MNIKKSILKITSICLLLIVGVSCVKDVDFDQASDIKVEPVYELDFVYSRITAPKFTNGITDDFVPTLRDTLQDSFFSGDIGDKLLKAELFVSFENSINRTFVGTLQFLDDANTILFEIPAIAANVGTVTNPVITEHVIPFTSEDILSLKNATKLASAITIMAGATDLDGALILKSKAIYYTSLVNE